MLALVDELLRQEGEPRTKYPRDLFAATDVHSLDELAWNDIQSGGVLDETRVPVDSTDRPLVRTYLYFRLALLRGLDAIKEHGELLFPERRAPGPLLDEWASEFAATALSPADLEFLLERAIGEIAITVLEHEDKDGDVERLFETLNSKNTPLGQYDLFRNFILMRGALTQEARRELYTTEILGAERIVQDRQGLDLRQTRNNLDAFLQDFVATIVGSSTSSSSSARLFQDWWESDPKRPEVRAFLHSDLVPAMHAWLAAITAGTSLRTNDGSDLELPESASRALSRIENMARRSFVPVTMSLIKRWAAQGAGRSDSELIGGLRAVEGFIARSILAGRPSSPFRAQAVQGAQHLRNGTKDVVEWFRAQSPSDSDVKRAVLQSCARTDGTDAPEEEWVAKRDLALRVQSGVFAALIDGIACQLEGEDHVRELMTRPGERMTKNKQLEIEHLFPKRHNLWLPDLGEWGVPASRMESRLHSLGNVTVLPRKPNAKSSNKPLGEKQKILRSDRTPKFEVSREFHEAKRWTHEEVDARCKRLCDAALQFWPREI